jgi:DNA-binding MurR/RpiR family transcriptional regulator
MSSERPLVLLKKNYTSLSSHQKTIADFILANIDRVSGLAISELSNICHVSNTTVNRFLKKLGYESYPEFKLDLARVRDIKQDVTDYAVYGSDGAFIGTALADFEGGVLRVAKNMG